MIIKPRIRGFICTTAHPLGCAANVREQIDLTRQRGAIDGTKNALVIGCSGGYGLASRITAAFGCQANTIGVSLEKEASEDRAGSAGWYNNQAVDQYASDAGFFAKTFDGDAFSNEVKAEVIQSIKENLGQVDLIVYSLASPVRTHPDSGELFRSVIKPLGSTYEARNLTLNVEQRTGQLSDISLEPATEEETAATVAVMGGDDWQRWIDQCAQAGVLSDSFKTVAYTYLGNDLTYPIYRGGTLGKAKEDLDAASRKINHQYSGQGEALVAVLKAVVTQASTAIPVVPLYFSILFKVMKAASTHENCIAHIYRMFREQLYTSGVRRTDEAGRIRMDNLEMAESTQAEVLRRWETIDQSNLEELADVTGFNDDFLKIFGFGRNDVDYEVDLTDLRRIVSP